MARQTAVSFEEFLALSERDEIRRFEYVGGELIEMATGSINHNFIRDWITAHLLIWSKQHGTGWAVAEHLFHLPNGRGYRPDVAWLRDRPENLSCLEGCPDIAVEVISPTDTAEHFQRKISDYLSNGATVWAVSPTDRTLTVYKRHETVILTEDDALQDALLPGFSLPLREILVF